MPKVPSGKAGWNGKTRASAAPRPSAPRDQRTGSAYIFGAICPARGAGAALVMPICNSTTMSMQLAEISQAVSPGAHAVLLLDQAGRQPQCARQRQPGAAAAEIARP